MYLFVFRLRHVLLLSTHPGCLHLFFENKIQQEDRCLVILEGPSYIIL